MRKFSATRRALEPDPGVEQEGRDLSAAAGGAADRGHRINGECPIGKGQAARADTKAQALQKEVRLLEGRWRQEAEAPAPLIANLPPPALPAAPVRKRPLKIKVLAGTG
jgi:hypothetical protein